MQHCTLYILQIHLVAVGINLSFYVSLSVMDCGFYWWDAHLPHSFPAVNVAHVLSTIWRVEISVSFSGTFAPLSPVNNDCIQPGFAIITWNVLSQNPFPNYYSHLAAKKTRLNSITGFIVRLPGKGCHLVNRNYNLSCIYLLFSSSFRK